MSSSAKQRPSLWRLAVMAWSIAFPMLVVLPLVGARHGVDWLGFTANTAIFCALAPVFLVLHELCHALVAAALGLLVPRVTIGIGPQIARFRVCGTLVQVCIFPVSAFTHNVGTSTRARRLRGWLVVAAGPALNLAACIAVVSVAATESGWVPSRLTQGVDPMYVVYWVNLMMLVLNLTPYKTRWGGSDGLKLLTLPFESMSSFRNEEVLMYSLRGLDALEEKRYDEALKSYEEGLSKFPDSWVLLCDRAVAFSELGQQDRARQQWEALLSHEECVGSARALIEGNIAWSVLLSDERDLQFDVAERLSSSAYEGLGHEPSIQGTRGAVLAFRGDAESAIKLLEGALALSETATSRAHNAAWLALAHARAGSSDRAPRYVALSRELDEECTSLDVVERLIAAAKGDEIT